MITSEHERHESHDVVRLSGRLGASDSAAVAATLIEILECGAGFLHVDMAEVEFVDSSGLSALVTVLKRARRQEGDMVLLNVSPRVRALLELTRLHEIFELRDEGGEDGAEDMGARVVGL